MGGLGRGGRAVSSSTGAAALPGKRLGRPALGGRPRRPHHGRSPGGDGEAVTGCPRARGKASGQAGGRREGLSCALRVSGRGGGAPGKPTGFPRAGLCPSPAKERLRGEKHGGRANAHAAWPNTRSEGIRNGEAHQPERRRNAAGRALSAGSRGTTVPDAGQRALPCAYPAVHALSTVRSGVARGFYNGQAAVDCERRSPGRVEMPVRPTGLGRDCYREALRREGSSRPAGLPDGDPGLGPCASSRVEEKGVSLAPGVPCHLGVCSRSVPRRSRGKHRAPAAPGPEAAHGCPGGMEGVTAGLSETCKAALVHVPLGRWRGGGAAAAFAG